MSARLYRTQGQICLVISTEELEQLPRLSPKPIIAGEIVSDCYWVQVSPFSRDFRVQPLDTEEHYTVDPTLVDKTVEYVDQLITKAQRPASIRDAYLKGEFGLPATVTIHFQGSFPCHRFWVLESYSDQTECFTGVWLDPEDGPTLRDDLSMESREDYKILHSGPDTYVPF